MKSRPVFTAALLALYLLPATPRANAQVLYGTIVGDVTDTSKAPCLAPRYGSRTAKRANHVL